MSDWLAYLIFTRLMPDWLCTDGWRWKAYTWFLARAGRYAYRDHP